MTLSKYMQGTKLNQYYAFPKFPCGKWKYFPSCFSNKETVPVVVIIINSLFVIIKMKYCPKSGRHVRRLNEGNDIPKHTSQYVSLYSKKNICVTSVVILRYKKAFKTLCPK